MRFANLYKLLRGLEPFTILKYGFGIYLAIIFAFAGLYWAFDNLVYPDSHLFHLPFDDQKNLGVIDCIYYSFVSFNTIGYGDIYPQEPVVRIILGVQSSLFIVYNAAFAGLFAAAIIKRPKDISLSNSISINKIINQSYYFLSVIVNNSGIPIVECSIRISLYENGLKLFEIIKDRRRIEGIAQIDFDLTVMENRPLLRALTDKFTDTQKMKSNYEIRIVITGTDESTSQMVLLTKKYADDDIIVGRVSESKTEFDKIPTFSSDNIESKEYVEAKKFLTHNETKVPSIFGRYREQIEKSNGNNNELAKLAHFKNFEIINNYPTAFETSLHADQELFVSDSTTLYIGTDEELLPPGTAAVLFTYREWGKGSKILNEKLKHSKWIAHVNFDDEKIKKDEGIKKQLETGGYYVFRKEFSLTRKNIKSADLYILVDDGCTILLNGYNLNECLRTNIYGYKEINHLSVLDFLKFDNELIFIVYNVHSNTFEEGMNVYGLRYCLDIEYGPEPNYILS